MSGKNPEPLNVELVNGYYIFIDLKAGYRVGNAGYWMLQASPLATPWQAGFDERPAMRDFKPQAKRSFSEALLERRAL